MIQPIKRGFRTPADFVNAALASPAEHEPINPGGKDVELLTAVPSANAPENSAQAIASGAAEERLVSAPAEAATPAAPKVAKAARKEKTATSAKEAIGGATSEEASKEHRTAGDAEKNAPAAGKAAPWDNSDPRIITGYNFRMSTSLHQKLVWISENVPKHKSIQVILEKAVTGYVDDLIAKHYSPDGDA